MRFYADGPSIPDSLLERCDAGRVVFLCGAGVSFNSGMPTFLGLTQYVIEKFSPPKDSQIMQAFNPWLAGTSAGNVPLDQIFNLLYQEYGRTEVNTLVSERLLALPNTENIGYEHSLIKRISSNKSGKPQIVTTNFDLLFEHQENIRDIPIYVPPAFPDLLFGASIDGITYLHGRLASVTEQNPYVLSSADFGRAYLSEAWATKFISNLLESYTVVLVGYQAEDPPVKYLLQGLNHDGQFDRSKLYAFDKGLPENIEVKWRDRGVTAIAYEDHDYLWKTIEAWADRSDDPRIWRNRIIASAARDPKEMYPYERGQVAHVLRSVQGAKLFAEAEPLPHPEWICVLDAYIRSARKSKNWSFGDEQEIFEPALSYGLDDDIGPLNDANYRPGVSNDNLLEWRHGDDNPPDFHRLGGRQYVGHEAISLRLLHLMTWIGKSYSSPIIAWWAARKNGLHPRLIRLIDWSLSKDHCIHGRARHVWNLILEHHNGSDDSQWDVNFYKLEERIMREGWTPSVLRYFRTISKPCLDIKPQFGLHYSKPPSSNWDEVNLGNIAQFDIKCLDMHGKNLDVPDVVLHKVLCILEEQLSTVVWMLSDIEITYLSTPTCYPDREIDGRPMESNFIGLFKLFMEVYERLSIYDPVLAKMNAMIWDHNDRYFFRKLKLYALSKHNVFSSSEMINIINSFNQDAFWDSDVVRELLFVLVDRWSELTNKDKEALSRRVLSGPDKMDHWSDEEFPILRDKYAAKYARYLQLHGCELSDICTSRLDKIIAGIPSWNDEWAKSTVVQYGSYTYSVGTDETPDVVIDLPVDEIVDRAKFDLESDLGSRTNKRPFTGLVKANPRKALSALTVAAKKGDYPPVFWTALIEEFPQDISFRLRLAFLNRLAGLPPAVVVELRYSLSRWLKQNLGEIVGCDASFGWKICDHIVDSLLNGGADAVKSGIGEARRGGEVISRSRKTYSYAINGPLGICTEALLLAIPGEEQDAGSLLPIQVRTRLERLCSASDEGGDHAVAILFSRMNWVMDVDPEWVNKHLIPMLAFEHSMSEPAWNGLLHSHRNPSSKVAIAIKPLLLNLYPWIEGFIWEKDASVKAARWIAWMCIFAKNEVDGIATHEMRNVVREMSDHVRNQLISWLSRVGASNDDGWTRLVIPFIENAWPMERVFRTSTSVLAWGNLLDKTKGHFPIVYAAVKKFLVPIEEENFLYYRFTRELGEDKPITILHPEATLDFINTITPRVLLKSSSTLPKILALIEETAPELTLDTRYIRLIDLIERS